MTRHERRKAVKARNAAKLARLAKAELARRVSEVVKSNLSNPRRGHRSPKGMGNRALYTGSTGDYARGGKRPTFSIPNDQVKGKR